MLSDWMAGLKPCPSESDLFWEFISYTDFLISIGYTDLPKSRLATPMFQALH
jgi:hypothetical protein